ncbi:unnamed protein product [Somion occarium]|uniref:Oxidation resistance protein 1 n=1 Tax=Somion occarium TaxID=3059160 RepID=A0ABP1CS78_9APHY
MIPPLIPLPEGSNRNQNAEKDDLFSTLFSPSTPHASPILGPTGAASSSDARIPAVRHARTVSSDSEFGAFVSVPSAEDPLASSVREGNDLKDVSFSPLQNTRFFDRFAEEAKVNADKNKKGILEELLQHQDDPLYFLKPDDDLVSEPSPHSVQQNTSSSSVASLLDLDPDEPIPDPPNTELETELHEATSSHDTASRFSRHPDRHRNQTEPSGSTIHPLTRTPSLPPSPTRISRPEIQRTQSIFTPSSLTSSASSISPARWMSSLLSRPAAKFEGGTVPPSRSFTPPLADFHHRAQTMAASVPSPGITHGTPFASQPYIPPSGAPGFAGDRTWNTGKFEFDKENVEKRSVKLVGRKEMTTPVLTVQVADMLRPYFPALARLPHSWTLLYSLDQHGISLHTLYSRCDGFLGSTLVIMKDSNDTMFGAWLGEGVHPSKGSYYGSGESFLWKMGPDNRVRVFKWTGKNDYIALCEPDYISFGGGDGRYGLYLDETLLDGSSAPCPTFDNDPLCSSGPRQGVGYRFECVGLEVWGIGS